MTACATLLSPNSYAILSVSVCNRITCQLSNGSDIEKCTIITSKNQTCDIDVYRFTYVTICLWIRLVARCNLLFGNLSNLFSSSEEARTSLCIWMGHGLHDIVSSIPDGFFLYGRCI